MDEGEVEPQEPFGGVSCEDPMSMETSWLVCTARASEVSGKRSPDGGGEQRSRKVLRPGARAAQSTPHPPAGSCRSRLCSLCRGIQTLSSVEIQTVTDTLGFTAPNLLAPSSRQFMSKLIFRVQGPCQSRPAQGTDTWPARGPLSAPRKAACLAVGGRCLAGVPASKGVALGHVHIQRCLGLGRRGPGVLKVCTQAGEARSVTGEGQ